jgi:hypothetical protein
MIEGLVDNEVLPGNLRKDTIERTDDIPLFVEQMTKALLEAGAESAARQTTAAVPSAALAVPASLHASLVARLDRLGAPRQGSGKSAQRLGMSFPCSAWGGRGEARVGAQFSSRPAHYSRFAISTVGRWRFEI